MSVDDPRPSFRTAWVLISSVWDNIWRAHLLSVVHEVCQLSIWSKALRGLFLEDLLGHSFLSKYTVLSLVVTTTGPNFIELLKHKNIAKQNYA